MMAALKRYLRQETSSESWLGRHRQFNICSQLDGSVIAPVPLSPRAVQLEQDAQRRTSQRMCSLLSMPSLNKIVNGLLRE